MAQKKSNNRKRTVHAPQTIQIHSFPEGKRFWRSKVHIEGYGLVEGEVTEEAFKAFTNKLTSGVEIDLDRWCITAAEQKIKENIQKEKKRLAKA